jgi:hypothetical protein
MFCFVKQLLFLFAYLLSISIDNEYSLLGFLLKLKSSVKKTLSKVSKKI